jgi:cell division protein FtsX
MLLRLRRAGTPHLCPRPTGELLMCCFVAVLLTLPLPLVLLLLHELHHCLMQPHVRR